MWHGAYSRSDACAPLPHWTGLACRTAHTVREQHGKTEQPTHNYVYAIHARRVYVNDERNQTPPPFRVICSDIINLARTTCILRAQMSPVTLYLHAAQRHAVNKIIHSSVAEQKQFEVMVVNPPGLPELRLSKTRRQGNGGRRCPQRPTATALLSGEPLVELARTHSRQAAR